MEDFWLKQNQEKPLFRDLMWSKPENKSHAGKLLIIGGSSNGFAHTVSCYTEAIKAGAGVVKVLIPESIKKIVGNRSNDIFFGPSTKSGGFNQVALADFLETSNWADNVLLSGEMGNNSETSILFEKYIDDYAGSLVIAGDAFDFTYGFINKLIDSHLVTYVLDFSKLQKLSINLGLQKPITSSINLVNLIDVIHHITMLHQASLVIRYNDFVIVSSEGFVSSTNLTNHKNIEVKLAAHASVWYMQNKLKVFEALSCAAITSQIN